MKIDNNMSQIFNMEPIIEGEIIMKSGEVIIPEVNKQSEKIDYDYDKTRGNLHSLLSTGQEALMHALEIAKSSEDPKAFSVVGNLMKQLSDINSQLLDLHRQKQRLDTLEHKGQPATDIKTVTNNSIFVGSTAELSKLINKNMTQEKDNVTRK